MMSRSARLTATLLSLALVSPAYAGGPRKVLVLPLEGSADAAARTRVGGLINRLARGLGGSVSVGDTTFADTAAAVGCEPAAAACRDEVLSTLAVDELVYGAVDLAGSDVRVTLHRATRGAATRDASVIVADREPLDPRLEAAVGPLFGAAGKATDAAKPAATAKPADATKPVTAVTTPGAGAVDATKPAGQAGASTSPGPTSTDAPLAGTSDPLSPEDHARIADPAVGPTAAAGPTDAAGDPLRGRRRLYVAGAAGSGAILLLGVLFWAEASSTQGDIDAAPTRTLADLKNLAALEDKASAYATWGNLMVLGGLALGGVSGYLLYKDHKARHASGHARLLPALVPGGVGVTLTIGGLP